MVNVVVLPSLKSIFLNPVMRKMPRQLPRPFSAIRICINSKNWNVLKTTKSRLFGSVNFIKIGRFLVIYGDFCKKNLTWFLKSVFYKNVLAKYI